jgi:hypothetical protein
MIAQNPTLQMQSVRRAAVFKPFTAATASSRRALTTYATSPNSHTAQPVVLSTIPQRLASAALAAFLLLSSGAAFAIGPVSVKLEDLQISRTDCGGGLLCFWTPVTLSAV